MAGGTAAQLQTISTLNPEQQKLFSSLAPYLQSRIGQGLPAYTGQLTAGATPLETASLSKLSDYVQNVPDIQSFGLSQYKNALSGMNPAETSDWYNTYVLPEQKRLQEQIVIPGVREAYAGPLSAYYSEPRMGAEARSWNQFGTTQQSALGNAILQNRQSAQSMLPYLDRMSALEGGVPQVQAGMQYGEVARQIQQQELTSKFDEFKRTTPELSPVIDQIMQLLGITTQASYVIPGQAATASPFASILSALAPAAGAVLAGPIGGALAKVIGKTSEGGPAGTEVMG